MEEIAKAAESGEVVEGDVTEFNKGGVVVNVKGVKVFVPRSQATMRRDEDYTCLLYTSGGHPRKGGQAPAPQERSVRHCR